MYFFAPDSNSEGVGNERRVSHTQKREPIFKAIKKLQYRLSKRHLYSVQFFVRLTFILVLSNFFHVQI